MRRHTKFNRVMWAIVGLFSIAIFIANGQSPKDSAYRLPPAASAKWLELEKAQQDIIREANRQLSEIAAQKDALRLGAGIPVEMVPTQQDGVIVFTTPPPSPTPLPKEKP